MKKLLSTGLNSYQNMFQQLKINKVNKIVGPGNDYVARAKREVFGDVGIEGMIAGPSEITVVADKNTNLNERQKRNEILCDYLINETTPKYESNQESTINACNFALGSPSGPGISSTNFSNKSSIPTPVFALTKGCLLYTSPSPRDRTRSRMPSSA